MLKAPLLDIAHETWLWGAQLRLHAPGAAFDHLWGGLPKTGLAKSNLLSEHQLSTRSLTLGRR